METERVLSEVRTRHFFANMHKYNRDDGPTTKEETRKYGENSKKLLMYAACLNSAMVDLELELRDAGILRHAVKRNFNRASKFIEKVSSALFKGVAAQISPGFCRLYNSCMEESINRINDRVTIKQPEKAYNIVMSLIRLTMKSNNSIGRFKQEYIDALVEVEKMLDCGLKDYNLDIIVVQTIDEITLP